MSVGARDAARGLARGGGTGMAGEGAAAATGAGFAGASGGPAVNGTDIALPGAGTAVPGAGMSVPGGSTPLPGAGAAVPGAGTAVLGEGMSVPGGSTPLTGAGATGLGANMSGRGESIAVPESQPSPNAFPGPSLSARRAGYPPSAYRIAFGGIARREALRFLNQRGRFLSALVRPLVWLFIFAAGFRAVLGLSITPPYQTYVLYEVYVTPGLVAMIQLFNGMQSSLSMVYDRETGAMRTLLVSPLPRWFLLLAKLAAGVLVSIIQAYVFLAIAWFWEVRPPLVGYVTVLPALILSGLMLGALGLLISSTIRQLENFAGVMNFVIFPMFFASTALYPLWRMAESSTLLHDICAANPFSHAVELIRFALYGQVNWLSLGVVAACLALFFGLAVRLYDPGRGGPRRKEG